MPRRKQDCPKRMKWELENLAAAAALRRAKEAGGAGGVLPSLTVKDNSTNNDTSEESSDDGQKTSESEDSPSRSRGGSEISRDSHSPSPFKTPSPVLNVSNGSILDFSQRRGHGGAGNSGESPLDLSVSSRKDEITPPPKKVTKWSHDSPRTGTSTWNGSSSAGPDMTSKALEKMSELSRVGHGTDTPATTPKPSSLRSGSSSSWQAQWLAQSSGGTKDVLRCVCCRLTFPSLLALSAHMKEANHGPPLANLPSPKGQGTDRGVQNQSTHPSLPISHPKPPSSPNDSSALLKETVQLPRKLVRGQDVWLGKGAEQTRQILKCMWCGQSFRTLAEMTSHMQQTQHYTNIISQEQLISWRSSEDKSSSPNSHVSAVLTCKVCDQAFSSLKELSNHMVKNSHYKEHIMRSITESGSRRRQSREKRKKSLPVRKLLELERANSEIKKEIRITCEKCSEKIPAPAFVDHLRHCELGGSKIGIPPPPPAPGPISLKKSPKRESSSSVIGESQDLSLPKEPPSGGTDTKKESSSVLNAIEKMIEKSFDFRSKGSSAGGGSNSAHPISPPVGTSILKRLGIDESVDYTKPLLDPSVLPLSLKFSSSSRPRSVSSEKSSDDLGSSNTKTPTPPTDNYHSHHYSTNKSERRRSKRGRDDNLDRNDGGAEGDKDTKTGSANNSKGKSSLSALSSMFESIGGGNGSGGGAGRAIAASDGKSSPLNHFGSASNSHHHHHPLAALQQLCDKTENTPPTVTSSSASRPTSTSSSNPQSSPGIDPTSLLGLNWTPGTGNVDGENNVFKCTFCDSPFLSKGAYRHHLAKMHFIQEKSPPLLGGPKDDSGGPPSGPSPTDSPTSKFIKYTELAKQLSSK